MAAETPQLTGRGIATAARNYVDCLILPPQSQVLIVTDKMPQDPSAVDQNVQIRRTMADHIEISVGRRYPTVRAEFNHDTPAEVIADETMSRLSYLDQLGSSEFQGNRITTVAYIGDAWLARTGMYDAVNAFAAERTPGEVRVAGSLGFTTGDTRVMSHMGAEQRAVLANASQYFTRFFQEHPQGRLLIATGDNKGNFCELSVNYDTDHAPFSTEIGQFDDNNQFFNGKFVYVNIPGGEGFLTPYPYQQTEGQFAAEGVVFTTVRGLVVGTDIADEKVAKGMDVPSLKLLSLVQGGRGIPIAELGLGFYALAGIETYVDSSVLSREKGGPHIGMGHGYTSDESDAIAEAAGDFHHTDFVMGRSTTIVHEDLRTSEQVVFYPPQTQNS